MKQAGGPRNCLYCFASVRASEDLLCCCSQRKCEYLYNMSMADPSTPELIRARAAAGRLGVHPVTLRRWSERGDFPQPIRLGPRGDRFYKLSDIAHHLEQTRSTNG